MGDATNLPLNNQELKKHMNKKGVMQKQTLDNDFLNSTFTPDMLRSKVPNHFMSPIIGPFTQSPEPPMAPRFG